MNGLSDLAICIRCGRLLKLGEPCTCRELDEESFCDDDIRKMFRGVSRYTMGMPLMAQLIKELRLIRQELVAMREKNES